MPLPPQPSPPHESRGNPLPTTLPTEQPAGDCDPEEGRLRHLMHRLAAEDPSARYSGSARLLLTLGPLVVLALIILATHLLRGARAAAYLAGVAVGSFIGGGKFVILIGAAPDDPLGVWAYAHMVIYGDIAVMLIMMANLHLLYRLPWVGRKLTQAHEASFYVLKANPWMRRLAWVGLAVFVAAPFQGTGAVGGTILARILGLSRLAILTAIPVGSLLGCYPIALLGLYGKARGLKQIADHPVAAVAFFVILILVIYLLGRRFTGASLRKQDAASGTYDAGKEG